VLWTILIADDHGPEWSPGFAAGRTPEPVQIRGPHIQALAGMTHRLANLINVSEAEGVENEISASLCGGMLCAGIHPSWLSAHCPYAVAAGARQPKTDRVAVYLGSCRSSADTIVQ
jgi:hypothetical protein